MKKIESGKDLNKLDGVVYELYQLNALIGFMQVSTPSVSHTATHFSPTACLRPTTT